MSTITSIPKRFDVWFRGYNFVKFDMSNAEPWQKGQISWPKGHVFRAKLIAGPANVSNIIHEMAHLIEIPDHRAHIRNFGLDYTTKQYVFGQEFLEPVTDQAVQREIRVFAIQAVLSWHMRLPVELSHFGHLIMCGALMDDFLWRKNVGMNYEEALKKSPNGTKEIEDTTTSVIQSLADTLSIEDLWTEWNRKCKIVESKFSSEGASNEAVPA